MTVPFHTSPPSIPNEFFTQPKSNSKSLEKHETWTAHEVAKLLAWCIMEYHAF